MSHANELYSLKLKRPQTVKMYRNELDRLYTEALAGDSNSGMKAKL